MNNELLELIADELDRIRVDSGPGDALPSAAEFIDTVAACVALKLMPSNQTLWKRLWSQIAEATLKKHRSPDDGSA